MYVAPNHRCSCLVSELMVFITLPCPHVKFCCVILEKCCYTYMRGYTFACSYLLCTLDNMYWLHLIYILTFHQICLSTDDVFFLISPPSYTIKHFTDASACIVPPPPVATNDTTPPGSDGKGLIYIHGCIHTWLLRTPNN